MEVWPNEISCINPYDSSKRITIRKRKIKKIVYQNGQVYNVRGHDGDENFKEIDSYIKFGIIPYVVLGRSSGGCIGYNLKKVHFEYRYAYTYPTNWYPAHFDDGSRFFYQGDNHSLIISLEGKNSGRFGLLFGYKSWWFSRQYVPLGDIYSILETSSYARGPCFGIEYNEDLSKKWFNADFFIGLSLSFLSGRYTLWNHSYYYDRNKDHPFLHFSTGFKLGGRVKVNKPKK